MKRFFIILVAVMWALTGFARATDNKTFERFYNLTPKEFEEQLNYYILHNQTDSAILCANIQASKYCKVNLTKDELEACCAAFRYMGLEYLDYNYQLAAENLLKAEQIAKKYGFTVSYAQIALDKAILIATQNDLENNFVYNKEVIDGFVNAFHCMLDQLNADNKKYNKTLLGLTTSNLLYLAIKFDKTNEVTKEVQTYHVAQKHYGVSCNVAEVFCNAVENYNTGNYDKAFEALQVPIIRSPFENDRDFIQNLSSVKIAQYAVLVKCGKRAEALKLLQQHEQDMRENGMTFEQLEALQLIWQHYEKDGNKAMADKYALQYYTTINKFINKSKVGKIDQAKLNIELEQTRDRIQEMSYRQKIQTIVLWGAVIIALLAFALLGVMWVNYRKTRRTNKLLYNKNVALLEANKELTLVTTVTATTRADKQANDEPTQADRELLEKIKEVLSTSDEIYSGGFTRQRLAELVGVNDKYVSRAINSCSQGNFNALLNEYRIKEACHRLIDTEKYGGYSIEGIANSVGMSRGYFSIVFKEIVGLTPSAFQKMTRDKGTIPTKEEE